MKFSLFPLLTLLNSVIASPSQDDPIFKRTNSTVISNALSSLSSIESVMKSAPPATLQPALTALPSYLYDVATSPSAIASIAAEFASSPPEWFKSLDSAAQSYIISKSEQVNSLLPVMESLQAVAGISITRMVAGTAVGTAVSTAVKTTEESLSASTTKAKITITQTSSVPGVVATEQPSATAGGQAASSTKQADAARQSGALAAVVLTAMGVLGIAVVL